MDETTDIAEQVRRGLWAFTRQFFALAAGLALAALICCFIAVTFQH